MYDIWGFLLQTCTVSGAAALLLLMKALFKDKLPPKWHFMVWSILGLMMLLPAGFQGRYTLIRWQLPLELLKTYVGDYSFTKVLHPFPVLTQLPKTVLDWIFTIYVAGIFIFLAKYLVSYIHLKLVLVKGVPVTTEIVNHIQKIAALQKVRVRKIIQVEGLPSAFVFGVFRPVLVLPDRMPEDKVILHELFHLKNRDTLWSIFICFFRCLHWCSPLIVYCAGRALNDMESRCDQFVLEQLEGEERRDYGQILLSMANDRFAKTPGSSCINNGGKNLRERIKNIARFKKYPVGMGLVSACVMILLTFSLVMGVESSPTYDVYASNLRNFASAKATPCTTVAGAIDTYAKAILTHNPSYRAMCAPEAMLEEFFEEMDSVEGGTTFPGWPFGLPKFPDESQGYTVYNLIEVEPDVYEGLLLVYFENDLTDKQLLYQYAYQNIQIRKENYRYVVIANEAFVVMRDALPALNSDSLPSILYSATISDFRMDVTLRHWHTVDNTLPSNTTWNFFGGTSYDTVLKPHTEFDSFTWDNVASCTRIGTAEKDELTPLDITILTPDGEEISSGSGNLYPKKSPSVTLTGGFSVFGDSDLTLPKYLMADIYINHSEEPVTLKLQPAKGDNP